MNPDFHHIPGRLRVRIPQVKRNEAAAQAVQRRLTGLPGVTSARANVVTGSVTVTYDPQAISGDDLVGALAESGYVARDIADGAALPIEGVASGAIDVSASRAGEVLAKVTFSFIVEKAIVSAN